MAGWDDASQVAALQKQGIELLRGDARIDGPGAVAVDGRRLATGRIVIATGSQPMSPPIPGLDEVDAWTTRDATSVRDIPERLLLLCGGAVGVELAQAFARLGSSVAIVEGEDRLLPRRGGTPRRRSRRSWPPRASRCASGSSPSPSGAPATGSGSRSPTAGG